jgi:hypothetical protein
VDPVPDPLLCRKFGSAGNRTREHWVSNQEQDEYNTYVGVYYQLKTTVIVFRIAVFRVFVHRSEF